jgi:hypothetical protein
MQAAVALITELLGRPVTQRAVRANGVELLAIPPGLGAGVRHRLELLAVHELVAETAVERFDETVLPRMPRGHRDRLESHSTTVARTALKLEQLSVA